MAMRNWLVVPRVFVNKKKEEIKHETVVIKRQHGKKNEIVKRKTRDDIREKKNRNTEHKVEIYLRHFGIRASRTDTQTKSYPISDEKDKLHLNRIWSLSFVTFFFFSLLVLFLIVATEWLRFFYMG